MGCELARTGLATSWHHFTWPPPQHQATQHPRQVFCTAGVTRFTGVPTMVKDMLEHPTYKAEAFATMKNIAAGASWTYGDARRRTARYVDVG